MTLQVGFLFVKTFGILIFFIKKRKKKKFLNFFFFWILDLTSPFQSKLMIILKFVSDVVYILSKLIHTLRTNWFGIEPVRLRPHVFFLLFICNFIFVHVRFPSLHHRKRLLYKPAITFVEIFLGKRVIVE